MDTEKPAGNGDEKKMKRGPRGGRKHRPGRDHVKKQVRRSEQKRRNKFLAAKKRKQEEDRRKSEEYWQSLSPEKRWLLRGKKGVDPNA